MKSLKMILTAVLFMVALGFGLLNNENISVSYYFGHINMTSGFSLILSFVLGGLFGMILGSVRKKI
jgi:uncharacterized integral membrane protein